MLKLRQEQVDALSADKRRRDVKLKAIELRNKYPLVFQFYTDEQLLTWLQRQELQLKTYGITTQSAAQTVLDLFCVYGENFERCADNRPFLEILTAAHMDADSKATLLVHRLATQAQ